MPAPASLSPELSFRAYGNQNFERFDNVLAGGDASLGRTEIGKVVVDCRFLFTKSQWGVLRAKENPAGIIYLDLTFSQPSDCRLKKATVTLTLDDDDEELRAISGTGRGPVRVPVQIGAIGPEKFGGQAKRVYRLNQNQFIPNIEGAGMVGIGGIGHKSEEHSYKESRWQFSGKKETNPKSSKNSWAYRVIRWDLEENELESQSTHSNVIHTGFSFEHDGQPFFMQVEVSGELESRRSDFKHRMKSRWKKTWKFPADPRVAPCATTLINFGGRNVFHKPLDELETGLALAMQEANMSSVPIQIPNPRAATFHEDLDEDEAFGAGLPPPATIVTPAPNLLDYRREGSFVKRHPGRISPRRASLLEQGPTLPGTISGEATESSAQLTVVDRTLPTTENLAYVSDFLTRPPAPQPKPTAWAKDRRNRRMRRQAATIPVPVPEEVEIDGAPRRRQRDSGGSTSRSTPGMPMDTSGASSISLLNQDVNPVQVSGGHGIKHAGPRRDAEPRTLFILFITGLVHIPHVIFYVLKTVGMNIAEGSRIVVPDSDSDTSSEESEEDEIYGKYGSRPLTKHRRR